MRTKTFTTSNNKGAFTILGKAGDELFFISKNHSDKIITIAAEDFNKPLLVELTEKPIELEEVEIVKSQAVKFKVSQADLDVVKLQKQANTPVVQGVYTGEIVNGADFVRMGKGIAKLFKKKDEDKLPPKPVIVFKEYVSAHYTDRFFTETLKLKPEQIYAFIDYCDSDPKAATIVQDNNSLAVLEFLMAKCEVFKKLR